MIIIENNSTDPYFNLACEEYLLDNTEGELLMLWRNDNAVVIGRNQNAYTEVNIPYTEANGIRVVRRLTGGGAVFHDLGNLNYSLILPRGEADALDFARFSSPVIAALKEMGIPAELSGRNDIVAGGKKISGNAQCVRSGRLMHHGTLLYSADLGRLSGALKVDREKLKGKGIRSVGSRVANIRDFPGVNGDICDFTERVAAGFSGERRTLSEDETDGAVRLAETKYSTWEWNFGASKLYNANLRRRFEFGTVEAGVTADGGVITGLSFSGDFFGSRDIDGLSQRLIGLRLDACVLTAALEGVNEYILGAAPFEIAALLTGADAPAANEGEGENFNE